MSVDSCTTLEFPEHAKIGSTSFHDFGVMEETERQKDERTDGLTHISIDIRVPFQQWVFGMVSSINKTSLEGYLCIRH